MPRRAEQNEADQQQQRPDHRRRRAGPGAPRGGVPRFVRPQQRDATDGPDDGASADQPPTAAPRRAPAMGVTRVGRDHRGRDPGQGHDGGGAKPPSGRGQTHQHADDRNGRRSRRPAYDRRRRDVEAGYWRWIIVSQLGDGPRASRTVGTRRLTATAVAGSSITEGSARATPFNMTQGPNARTLISYDRRGSWPRRQGHMGYAAGERGSRMVIVVPRSRRLSTPIVPPCACTIAFAIASPSPVPPLPRWREVSAR